MGEMGWVRGGGLWRWMVGRVVSVWWCIGGGVWVRDVRRGGGAVGGVLLIEGWLIEGVLHRGVLHRGVVAWGCAAWRRVA